MMGGMSRTHRALPAVGLVLLAACGSSVVPAPPRTKLDRAELAARVRAEFQHAWDGYVRHAWGHDELRPVSRSARDWHREPLLITAVDSLDSLILLGLDEEAARTRAYIKEYLDFDRDMAVKNFEITIRLLGGLLSSHQMTGDPRLLELADDLGARLLPAFDSPTGMPYRFVNLKTGETWGAVSNPAEVGTLLLEFGALAKLTGKDVYYDRAKRALVELYRRRSKIGLVGEKIDVETGAWVDTQSHVGAGIDSYYEYLLKAWLLFRDQDCLRMWRVSRDAMNKHVADERPSGLWYGSVDMATGRRTSTVFGALEAFLPAVLALDGDLERARRLQDSAFQMWTRAGIAPDGFDYVSAKPTFPKYPLRPEIIESAYYLHRYTNDPRYLEMGVRFLDDIVACCRTDAGFTALESVVTRKQGDVMPSYFLAETLKYLYLLFVPDPAPVDLRTIVFTTEAHPLRRTW
jgi:mannosidase alpha-like ER degradation enhancer 2